jgi:hypothetical protein
MTIINLSDLQRVYRAKQQTDRRHDLRRYLIDGRAASAGAFQLVSRRLYADGLIDNLGLTDMWIAGATMTERAGVFSEIVTALLGGPK